jgi:hypothetical protein
VNLKDLYNINTKMVKSGGVPKKFYRRTKTPNMDFSGLNYI